MSQSTSTASTPVPGDGSRTVTVTNDPTREEGEGRQNEVVGTLRLRGGPARRNRPRVAWDEGVIDNEDCGRKSSKICCIYHKPRRFDESSSSESDSDSDSDSDVDSCKGHNHESDNHRAGGSGDGVGGSSQQPRPTPSTSKVHEHSDDEPNAYERMPRSRRKGKRKAEP